MMPGKVNVAGSAATASIIVGGPGLNSPSAGLIVNNPTIVVAGTSAAANNNAAIAAMNEASASPDLFCLKWSNFQRSVSGEFKRIQEDEDLVDITFACEGGMFGAHKLVLFACSPYLKDLLKNNPSTHPIFFMMGVKPIILKSILDFMYIGEVRINQDDFTDFIRVAELFKIRGVTRDNAADDAGKHNSGMQHLDGMQQHDNHQQQLHQQQQHHQQQQQLHLAGDRITTKHKKPRMQQLQQQQQSAAAAAVAAAAALSAAQNEQALKKNTEFLFFNDATVKVIDDIQPKRESTDFGDELCHAQPGDYAVAGSAPSSSAGGTGGGASNRSFGEPNVRYLDARGDSAHEVEYEVANNSNTCDDAWLTEKDETGAASGQLHQQHQQQQQQQQHQSTQSSGGKRKSSGGGGSGNKSQCLVPSSCPVCGRVYSNISNLRQHLRLIHNPTTVDCPICHKSFNSDLYLKRHYLSMHNMTASPATGGVVGVVGGDGTIKTEQTPGGSPAPSVGGGASNQSVLGTANQSVNVGATVSVAGMTFTSAEVYAAQATNNKRIQQQQQHHHQQQQQQHHESVASPIAPNDDIKLQQQQHQQQQQQPWNPYESSMGPL